MFLAIVLGIGMLCFIILGSAAFFLTKGITCVLDAVAHPLFGFEPPAVALRVAAWVCTLLVFIPGLVTSAVGLLMLAPPTRSAMRPLAAGLAARGLSRHVTFVGGRREYIDGEVIESDPPRRLVQTWHPQWDPEIVAEGARQVTWEIVSRGDGSCTLTITHELANAPKTRAQVSGELKEAGGGWNFVLADLKTLLETGTSVALQQQTQA